MIAIGLSFCFKANLWNIGAEGQFVAGGALGGWLGLVTAAFAWYASLAGVMNATAKRVVFPTFPR